MHRRPSVELETGDIARILQNFTEEARHTVEASADGLVQVRMGPTFTIQSIEILDPGLDRDQKQRLEGATLAAVNAAIRKIALSAGQALVDFQASKTEPIPIIHVDTAADFIKRHYDWARDHQLTGVLLAQARIGFLLTESRPAAFGAQVTEMEPVVAIATGDLYLSEPGQLSGDGSRQTINASRAVIGTDSVHLVLSSSDGVGTLQVPHEVKVFDINHCVLIGSRNRGILGQIATVSPGEVMTLMLWGKEGVPGPH
jgi:DNA-binding protein YbaB